MASSELNDSDYYNVQLDLASKDIPEKAVKAQAYIFLFMDIGKEVLSLGMSGQPH